MKYRIVRNGLGEYAVQRCSVAFWTFVKDSDVAFIGSSERIAIWKTAQDAQDWIDKRLARIKEVRDKKTWEVVG